MRWAKRQKLTSIEFAAIKWDGPTRLIDTEARWAQARRLLHEPSIETADRVAGLLVQLYAQWPAAISRLTLDHVHTDEHKCSGGRTLVAMSSQHHTSMPDRRSG